MKTLKLNGEEAMLIDWLLTMHSYSSEYLEWLMTPDFQDLRYQAGNIILEGAGLIELEEDTLNILLALVPITFRFGTEDVGFALKKKLYDAKIVRFKEVKNASSDPSKDEANSSPEDSSATREESISS